MCNLSVINIFSLIYEQSPDFIIIKCNHGLEKLSVPSSIKWRKQVSWTRDKAVLPLFASMLIWALCSCASPELKRSFEYAASDNEAALLYVLPRAQRGLIDIVAVDLKTGQTLERRYTLGNSIMQGGRRIAVTLDDLPVGVREAAGSTINHRLEFGFLTIEPGDYAVYQFRGHNYIPNCVENNAIVFNVSATSINILDDLRSLAERTGSEQEHVRGRIEGFELYVAGVLEAYSGIRGEARIVSPKGFIDFGEPSSLGILRGQCATSRTFEKR